MSAQATIEDLPTERLATRATDPVETERLTTLWAAIGRKTMEAGTVLGGLDIVPPDDAWAATLFAEVLLDAAQKVREIGEAEAALHQHLVDRAVAILDRVDRRQAAAREEVPIA